MEFVNELLAGKTYAKAVPIPGHPYMTGVVLGDCRMSNKSWPNLKKRLINNGYIFKIGDWKDGQRSIEMRFSA
ncbi:hypothetical protein SEA_ATUIN_213 [Arthrobacter phage Atuin]|nr:hypothetical protein SEA_ATUIN_12 [Arthrobacter phage Atuin]